MASLAALTVALSLLAAPPQSQLAFGPAPHEAAGSNGSGSSTVTHSESADDREAAKRAFDRGLEAVASGEFEAAVSAFERAYRLRPHPVTLFNLALALEKAGRLPEAWELFDDVIDVVESDGERREVRRHMRTIANEIAIVEIDAHPRARLCIDGIPVPSGDTEDYRLAITPGPHTLLLDDHEFNLEFTAGDRRMLLLDDADSLVDERRRGPLMPAMVGVTIGGGALAMGLGIGAAAASRDSARTGLAAGAATTAGIAVAAGIVALLIETRTIADPTAEPPAPGPECPQADAPERLDLELGPTVDRPVQFAGTIEQPSPALSIPRPQVAVPSASGSFPHPHSIVPPRRQVAQNRPTTTTPM